MIRVRSVLKNLCQRASLAALLMLAMAISPMVILAEEEASDGPIAIAKVNHDGPVDFEKEVLPLLRQSCVACHNQKDSEGELSLETPQLILKGGESGPAVVAGDSAESLLLQYASHSEEPVMPPIENEAGAKNLNPEQLGLIQLWIDQGAKGQVTGSETPDWQPLSPKSRPIYALDISTKGDEIVFGRANQINIYHLPTKKLAASLVDPALAEQGLEVAHRDMVQAITFSPDALRIASSGYRTVKIWHRESLTANWKLERTIGSAEQPETFVDRVTALDISPDGKRLATGGGEPARGGELKIWDLKTGALLHDIQDAHSDTILATKFSPDGKQLASGGADRMVKLFDTATGKMVKNLEGHTGYVQGVSWLADGKTLISGGADKAIKVWDAKTGAQSKKKFKPYEKEITSVTVLGDTKTFVVSGGNKLVGTWNTQGGKLTQFPGATDFMHTVQSSADGKIIAAGGQTGILRIWQSDGKSLATFE